MPGFLFHEVVFGPVRSRRLGLSLGVNVLPLHAKYCSFNCIYCECGWTLPGALISPVFPAREEISRFLEMRLKQLRDEQYLPDAITFAGNGEPTMHPEFPAIAGDTILLRDLYAPMAKVSVLSNSSMLDNPEVFSALTRFDNNIQKLDAGDERLFGLMNNPAMQVSFSGLVGNLKRFNGNVIIQSMFLKGTFRGEVVDNTTPDAVTNWIGHLEEIRPSLVMIYPIARETPVHNLEKIEPSKLEWIAERVRAAGIAVEVYH